MLVSNVNTPVTPNFTQAELYSKSPDAPSVHFLDDRAIEALQYIRELSNSPIRVTSTYRTPEFNPLIGGSSRSQHLAGKAIDFQWYSDNDAELKRLKGEFLKEGSLLRENLFQMGVRGFGFYETFVHLDVRDSQDWVPYGDDIPMIYQVGDTAYVYDVGAGFWRDYKNYIALAVMGLCIYLLIRTI